EGDATEFAARQRSDELVRERREFDGVDHSVDVAAGRAEQRGEVAQVLPHREVVVDACVLRDIAHDATQRGGARWHPEHGDGARDVALQAYDRAHERGLAAAAWSEQPDEGA